MTVNGVVGGVVCGVADTLVMVVGVDAVTDIKIIQKIRIRMVKCLKNMLFNIV